MTPKAEAESRFTASLEVWLRRLGTFLQKPRLGLSLALLAGLLSAPALWLDFYLDDHVGRYIYSDLEGAERLYRNYSAGYGLAIGDPVENHWQIEAGWAPWWHYHKLRLAMFRPVGVLLHRLDFWLWPDSPWAMHAHSLLWLGALVAGVTWMYRTLLGRPLGGAAALLFAVDHTHGFVVGHICNRHGLVGTLLVALCLGLHVRARERGHIRAGLCAPWVFLAALLTSESSVAAAGYVLAYELFAADGSAKRRALAALPYVAVTGIWRVAYTAAGYGAFGSGLYLDPGREPLRYLRAFAERGPLYVLGQFAGPPAEAYLALPSALAPFMLGWAVLLILLLGVALLPLLRADRRARFWCCGMLGALVPAASTDPHNRQLILASLGAMGLLAQLWQFYAARGTASLSPAARWGKVLAVIFIGFRLAVSPLLLPLSTTAIALTTPMHRAARAVGDEAAGGEMVFVTAPQSYTVRLVQLLKRVEGRPLPARIRTLSCGPQVVRLTRVGAHTLELQFVGGILSEPALELHRDRRLPLPPGTLVELEGLRIEVLHNTPDGRVEWARFTFERRLDDPQLVLYRWADGRFERFSPPAIGNSLTLEGARSSLGLR